MFMGRNSGANVDRKLRHPARPKAHGPASLAGGTLGGARGDRLPRERQSDYKGKKLIITEDPSKFATPSIAAELYGDSVESRDSLMSKSGKSYPVGPMLIRGIEHICYEYAHLMSAAYWSLHGSVPWRTHADDAFLLGYRKMHDFLVFDQRAKARETKDEQPDILARDYLRTGGLPNWSLPTWTREWRNVMDRQLAHLSYEREKSWDHRQWVPPLEAEFRQAWQAFLDSIDPQYKIEFANQIEVCSRKPGFSPVIKL